MTVALSSGTRPPPAFHAHRQWAAAALLAAAAFGFAGPAGAQDFPNKPIRIIVPYAAGGGVDIVARTLAEAVSKEQGFNVLVENRTGAGSNVGSTYVARSEPTGYTLLMGSNANAVNISLYDNMQYDPVKDLTPIMSVGRVPMVLLTGGKSQFTSVAQVVAASKAKPGSLNFGSGGAGTSEHLTSELFKRRAGIRTVHLPYRGGAAVYPDLIAGEIHLFFNNQLQAMPFIQDGRVRALGIASDKRSERLPNVPTLAEQGVPDLVASGWWGVMGPGDMPPELVGRLNEIFNKALASPTVVTRLASLGAERGGGTPEQFKTYFMKEMALWAEIIKSEKIKVE